MTESILSSTKQILGVSDDYTAFDLDIVTHINSAFSTLNQLGIGPENGYAIEDDTATWDAFFGTNLKYNSIKSYVYLFVRMLFDPPTTSYLIEALNKQREQFEWRLSVLREETEWVDPDPDPDPMEGELILDGGEP